MTTYVNHEDSAAQIPLKRHVIPRKWEVTCCVTGKKLTVMASGFWEAGDLIVDAGWRSDRFMGGLVCPEARAV